MKTRWLLPVLLAMALSACSREKQYSDADVRANIDSQVKERTAEIQQRATEDLDRRKAVEVKPKADSIILAHAKKRGDTTKH